MNCERCYKKTLVTTTSMFNTQTICMSCKKAETKHPRYKEAQQAEMDAVSRGDYNFSGIGYS